MKQDEMLIFEVRLSEALEAIDSGTQANLIKRLIRQGASHELIEAMKGKDKFLMKCAAIEDRNLI